MDFLAEDCKISRKTFHHLIILFPTWKKKCTPVNARNNEVVNPADGTENVEYMVKK